MGQLKVPPGGKLQVTDIDPAATHGVEKPDALDRLVKNLERLSVLQYLLYAESRRALLVVLQGIDAGGKDEQAKRFRARLHDKSKNWKFSPAGVREREYWDQYMEAYDDVLRKCSTGNAPTYFSFLPSSLFSAFSAPPRLGLNCHAAKPSLSGKSTDGAL